MIDAKPFHAACGQLCSPRARAATMTLWTNMPQSSRLPRPSERWMLKKSPTGASKKRKLRWCCACIASLSARVMPSNP